MVKTAAAGPFANADGSLGALLDKEPLLSNKRPPRRTPTLYGIEANEVLYKFLPDPTRIQPTTGVSLSDVREQSEIAVRRGTAAIVAPATRCWHWETAIALLRRNR